jgi:hypothetical protein
MQAANGPAVPDAGGRIQLDADADGFGNACDADFGNDGVVGLGDVVRVMSAALGPVGDDPERAVLDVNGDGGIGVGDYGRVRTAFGQPPGPSGLACAGAPPCSPP